MLSKFCKNINCDILKENNECTRSKYEKEETSNKVLCKSCRAYQLIEFLIENKELVVHVK